MLPRVCFYHAEQRFDFFAPPGAKLSNLRIGERVKIAYVRLGAVKDATRIAAGSNANPAG